MDSTEYHLFEYISLLYDNNTSERLYIKTFDFISSLNYVYLGIRKTKIKSTHNNSIEIN